jgi:membrane associated rhomboid family serine protease
LILGFIPIPIKIPSFIYIAIWIIGQFASGLFSLIGLSSLTSQGGVAYLVHIGGIIVGLFSGISYRNKLKRLTNRS